MMQTVTSDPRAYGVGIICALPKEKAAVDAMLDEEHPRLRPAAGDDNDYTFGKIGDHYVVVACLPGDMGTSSATSVATHMMRSFPIKIGLMVGICGGVPSEEHDIRLGDVVVSKPTGQHGGVVQWDFGKVEDGGGFRRTGTLNKPPRPLRAAVAGLEAKHIRSGHSLQKHLDSLSTNYPRMAKTYKHQGNEHDQLFEASYSHVEGESTCDRCECEYQHDRAERDDEQPEIFYGNIASGNAVVKDGPTRDGIAKKENILGFEMEAAGLMDTFPCLVIRGVCDYADSHKNKRWQPYAAAVAAAYAKELLLSLPAANLATIHPASEAMRR
jgi:nucleoside phosphorylase